MSRQQSLTLCPWRLNRLRRLLWGVLFSVLAWLSGTRQAEATCGDYLLHRGHEAFTVHTSQSEQPSTATDPEPSQRKPCHGPGCRQAPPPPPATPSAPVEFFPQQFAVGLSRDAEVADPLQCWLSMTARVWANDGYPLGLLRPPAA